MPTQSERREGHRDLPVCVCAHLSSELGSVHCAKQSSFTVLQVPNVTESFRVGAQADKQINIDCL